MSRVHYLLSSRYQSKYSQRKKLFEQKYNYAQSGEIGNTNEAQLTLHTPSAQQVQPVAGPQYRMYATDSSDAM